MKLIPFDPKELNKTYRVSVHRSGRIGFTSEAAEKMKLSDYKSANISRNGDDVLDTNLYLTLHKEKDTGAFRINTNGPYFSINIKLVLDAVKIDYSEGKAWFEMEEIEIEGNKVYKLKRKSKANTLASLPDVI